MAVINAGMTWPLAESSENQGTALCLRRQVLISIILTNI